MIEKIIGNSDKEFYIETAHVISKMADILQLAEITKNKELEKAARKMCASSESDWDKMARSEYEKGIIVD
ncbi:hypothetical protein LJC68_09095 [Bacteroidales bacterium OttesenSCG-928-B11]|nr:hypothetical protein [Bacteroidales bacterium OttesenSCG-928-E04]MDL2313016.1 hypothetical protein [Bacteroidales bacterium OttesenSCG-928-B11]MDL2326651.1 hypothetical protein [Bacteroidales bacterium OttesenSCG-928-A14]